MATKPTKLSQIRCWTNLADKLSFKQKNDPGQSETRTFTVPGVFVTSRLSVPETLRNLNSLGTKIPSDSVKQVVSQKKCIPI